MPFGAEGISRQYFYEQLVELEPDNSEALLDLSQIYAYQQMWDKAIPQYRRTLAVYPDNFRAAQGLQRSQLISGRPRLRQYYRFFEADSSGRDNDIKKYQIISDISVPLGERVRLGAEYTFSEREFSDFPRLREDIYRIYAYIWICSIGVLGAIGVVWIMTEIWTRAFYSTVPMLFIVSMIPTG